ncbi:hypothetical protein ABB37_02702 [Leptomonas pyrrhocoris]|uniref:Transmembrane protein n=1 Tax=Leptomonas pyrrhocoris TaxID=157538 RepID=A0A0M9G5U7_LEPPY|nr:hypothetical protein ABB37_02702 [Leptomonas pyrrhocoris]KPA82957.1 hypothetical protein ABB37_02702 [Leptomonas pyrrhocoris]|eukprot:XP_015661396.1 hypothetical protein ABB37_02702 [Leptomonas pyrrhocoris]
MSDATSPKSPVAQAQNSAGSTKLPADYQYRLEDCEMALARHHFTRDELQRGLTWTKVSTGFDYALIAFGGYFGWTNYRIAEHEASFLRSVTGNPYIRRVFTPFPFLSLLCVVFGLFALPVDLAALSVAKDRIQMEERAIQNGEVIRQDIIREGTAVASSAKKVAIK